LFDVDQIADALRDVILTEEVTETTPFWAALAIGLTGRLAADFGARVVRVCAGADPLSVAPADEGDAARVAHLHALQTFLCHGKECAPQDVPAMTRGSLPRTHVRLTYDSDTSLSVPIAGAGDLVTKTVVFAEDIVDPDRRQAPASELTIAAKSGLLDIVGRSDARPLMLGGHQISYSTGLSGFLAAAALLHADDLDRAEVSALGTALWINWKSLAAAAQGRPIPKRSAESGKWRTAPCADGHVALVYFDRDWPVLAKMTGDAEMQALAAERAWTDRRKLAELERRLEAWALCQTREQISAASKTFGLALGGVWTPAELLADPQYRARGFFNAAADRNAARPRLPMMVATQAASSGLPRRAQAARGSGPLAGIRVIDLGILTAGASTSAILADLGADVIKVESPTYLDPFRGTPGTSRAEGWWNNSDAFKSTNRNKRGICLDLKSPRGREIFLELAARSDVVIENFRRGVMQRLGLGYDALRAANGSIILASVSSQGENGPDAGNISFGSTLEATSGLAALTAYEDGIPLVTGMDLNYPDQVGSVFGASAIVAALHAVQRSAAGAHLDISQRELTTYLLGEAIIAPAAGIAAARGNASPEYILQDTFATKDGWVAISLKDEQDVMRALMLAAPHMAAANSRDIAECKSALSAWTSSGTSKDICARLNASGLAAAVVCNGQDAWHNAQQSFGGTIQPLARSPLGDIVKGFPLHMPQRPIAVTLPAPNLGQHTEEILRDILGLAPAEIEQLARDNVIGTRPASPNASRLD
jgi:crotonobetainyl-CoA:carnitine CoA-transferase CaiB-like acyl-CoA transferase